jgi:transketolase
LESSWNTLWEGYKKEHPDLYKDIEQRLQSTIEDNRFEGIKALLEDLKSEPDTVATRKSSLIALNALTDDFPELLGGSADLTGSVCTFHKSSKAITPDDANGDYIFYGVREFGMSAIMNGMALHGGMIPYAGTFLTFSDYSRNALRMAAMMELGVIHVLTHDSIGMGEDGPTHQPVEHVPSLRLIPGLNVWRPCDTMETAVAWKSSILNRKEPTALILTRQSLPQYNRTDTQLEGIASGGYILHGESSSPDAIIIATGSEVKLAMNAALKAAEEGIEIRVVSMPCLDIFEKQSSDYQHSVLPESIDKVMVIEASIASSWQGYAGKNGVVIGMNSFGMSAPASELFEHFGFSDENVYQKLMEMIKQ